MYLLYLHWDGYYLFRFKNFENIGNHVLAVRKSLNDVKKFRGMVKLKLEYVFQSTEEAKESYENIYQGILPFNLSSFISSNSFKITRLGCEHSQLKNVVMDNLGVTIDSSDIIIELVRSIKRHILSILKNSGDQLQKLKSLCNAKLTKEASCVGSTIPSGFNAVKFSDQSLVKYTNKLRNLLRPIIPEFNYNTCFKDDLLIEFLHRYLQGIDSNPKSTDEQFIKTINSTNGLGFTDTNIELVKELILHIVELKKTKDNFTQQTYQMTKTVAPNLTVLLESANLSKNDPDLSAAELITTAGNFHTLSMLTSNEIHTITSKNNLFKRNMDDPSLAKTELNKLKSRKSKCYSDKAALALKVDYFGEEKTDQFGQQIATIATNELSKWSDKYLVRIQQKDERIAKLKKYRKEKRKKWLKRKNESKNENQMEIFEK